MKRTTTMLAMVALLVALTAGVAVAAQVTCLAGGKCLGSEEDDLIVCTEGPDKIEALDGRDDVEGGFGKDTIKGGEGDREVNLMKTDGSKRKNLADTAVVIDDRDPDFGKAKK